MEIVSIKKYKNAKGYKVQILSNYSVFAINGATKEKSLQMHNMLVEEANRIIKRDNIKYYIIKDYQQPNYGIMGVNLTVFDTKEIYEKYISDCKKAEIKAKKEQEKYLIKRAEADKIEEEKKKENEELLKKLYKSRIKDINKIQVTLPSYDAMYDKCYTGKLKISVSSEEVEKVLNNIKEKPEYSKTKIMLGEDYLDYKLVNKIIKWLNKNTNNYKFNLINKKHSIMTPMAYCNLNETKYPSGSKQQQDAYDKLINYRARAFYIYRYDYWL